MIGFRSDVRLTAIDNSYTEGEDFVVSLYFNTMNTIVSPKSVFDVIFMLNGQFTMDEITAGNIGHMDIDSKTVLDELFNWGIVCESSKNFQNRYYQAKDKLGSYIVHFPIMSNANVMIAVLLQKLRVKSVFHENGVITKSLFGNWPLI